MQPAPTRLRSIAPPAERTPDPVEEESTPEIVPPRDTSPRPALSRLQAVGGFCVFVVWLMLFGSGIIVDTTPYRSAISQEGARQLRAEGQPAGDPAASSQPSEAASPVAPPADLQPVAPPTTLGMMKGWFIILMCFLPLNLAWLCVSASTLGAIGNLANLSDDRDAKGSPDTSNPLISAILRGFFVYLFLMSGLLLLDHAPFSNAGPSQYIRLAGFLSLFSFVVSYQPRLFGALIVSAFERIQVRAGENGVVETVPKPNVVQHTSIKTMEVESTSAATVPAETAESSGERPK